jgi:RNA polymerase primary sigma factor
MDLIQEGNLGLIAAASRYHYSYNTRFSTYAYTWIALYISRFIQTKAPFIVIPQRKEMLIRHIQYAQEHLSRRCGHIPNVHELAEYLNISAKIIDCALKYSYNVTSLDVDIESCPGQTMLDIIPDMKFSPDTHIAHVADRIEAHKLLNMLPVVERTIIYYRYNFDGEKRKKTLREIGELLGISAETVRQTEIRAIRRLKKLCTENGDPPHSLSA